MSSLSMLLATKLLIPVRRPNLVPRPHLIERFTCQQRITDYLHSRGLLVRQVRQPEVLCEFPLSAARCVGRF